jgi:hypothetical protein
MSNSELIRKYFSAYENKDRKTAPIPQQMGRHTPGNSRTRSACSSGNITKLG